MAIQLKPEIERYLEEQAEKHGLSGPGEYIEKLLERERQQAAEREEEIDQWLDRITGSLKTELSTEQIMDLTRSEV